jgi:ankyrin repeat protein
MPASTNDSKGHGALEYAAEQGRVAIVKLLVQSGADVAGARGSTSLYQAAANGHIDVVKVLRENGAVLGNHLSEANELIWQELSEREGRVTVLRALLVAGAEADFVHEDEPASSATSPLMLAARTCNPAAATLFVEAGADINRKTSPVFHPGGSAYGGGENALIMAVKALPKRPTDDTPMFWRQPDAMSPRCLSVITQLLDKGANPNSIDGRGELQSALMIAAERGQVEAAQALIKAGAKVEYTPDISQRVFKQGQEAPPLCSKPGIETALSLAEANGYKELGALLRSHGARC